MVRPGRRHHYLCLRHSLNTAPAGAAVRKSPKIKKKLNPCSLLMKGFQPTVVPPRADQPADEADDRDRNRPTSSPAGWGQTLSWINLVVPMPIDRVSIAPDDSEGTLLEQRIALLSGLIDELRELERLRIRIRDTISARGLRRQRVSRMRRPSGHGGSTLHRIASCRASELTLKTGGAKTHVVSDWTENPKA
jgi:hypothetical protein